ncbi:hypothetical protein BaRGS_00035201 [Batillaria attramentaria]|uniref:EF-hand domain-containing protein n=1 Tax=Batillaria attramentaria TaxID=370345 RepID=A0ABD0JF35_9CAEN
MKSATVVLLVVLSVCLMTSTDAGRCCDWFSICWCGKKRSSDGRPVDSVRKALKEVCPKGMKPEMDVTNLMQDAFNQADENKDGLLNANEVEEFAGLIGE